MRVLLLAVVLVGCYGANNDQCSRQELNKVKLDLQRLAKQTMLQQFFVEEKIRGDGNSGIKKIRGIKKGPENYYSASFHDIRYGAVHDHSDFARTIGMGEVNVVLNGVDFRTRHNDYKLKEPGKDYKLNSVVDIPFPDVPPEVLRIKDVQGQIHEMQQWFKAFKDQDYSVRDYRKYFKPLMCYLEGTWTLADSDTIQEPFQSDRHGLDAHTWDELINKVRYASYTGTKDRLENFAYMPTTIMSINETTGEPTYGQWNYRILCKRLKEDVPLSVFRKRQDLSYELTRFWITGQEKLLHDRSAHFYMYEGEDDRETTNDILDRLMSEIPGKDNNPKFMNEKGYGETLYDFTVKDKLVPLNTGYYHRWFKTAKKGAMGIPAVARGFNDDFLFVAQTTQPSVAPIILKNCTGPDNNRQCHSRPVRFSYALPLEILYLTPLMTWNPYQAKADVNTYKKARGPNGQLTGLTPDKAFLMADFNTWYLTPVAFFQGSAGGIDAADTVKGKVYMKDKWGKPQAVTASGTRVVLPSIPGVGQVRLRWPITPIHEEGGSTSKELHALKDHLFYRVSALEDKTKTEARSFKTKYSNLDKVVKRHVHTFNMTAKQFYDAKYNNKPAYGIITSVDSGHKHQITVGYKNKEFYIFKCDSKKWEELCWDQHSHFVIQTDL